MDQRGEASWQNQVPCPFDARPRGDLTRIRLWYTTPDYGSGSYIRLYKDEEAAGIFWLIRLDLSGEQTHYNKIPPMFQVLVPFRRAKSPGRRCRLNFFPHAIEPP